MIVHSNKDWERGFKLTVFTETKTFFHLKSSQTTYSSALICIFACFLLHNSHSTSKLQLFSI